ncbi:hypothetical protein K504DRAFT_508044 [Pleomassaria siparia CBS 279.74]|uniref:histidine kinase n=1 Tax=Pleomassaria siparia CBS 279.74 TaxID=1314801 RepID=A0A6G1JS88_9PLEO|nr:hypothetical protein K504DRAFT_508044 [Pleomassaria siparia CBS 279.74]
MAIPALVSSESCEQLLPTLNNSERVRAYEIAAYLSAASFPLDIPDGPPKDPIPNSDVTLNALVQHGTHMMDCDRAFLSLIDNRSQFICAEMTRHQSLVRQDPTRPLLLGIAKVALEWGVCPYTISVFHGHTVGGLLDNPYIEATEEYFFIKDFRQVPSFADRPFVTGYPHMVSYIEIPLTSISGHVLGSYCIVDDKSRDFQDPKSLDTMREVTSAISKYLDLKRVEGSRTRSERMMDELSQFIDLERQIPREQVDAVEASGPHPGPFDLHVFNRAAPIIPTPASHGNTDHKWPAIVNCGGNVSSNSTDASLDVDIGSFTPILKAPVDGGSNSTLTLFGETTSTAQSEGGSSTTRSNQHDQSQRVWQDLPTQINDLFSNAARMIGHAMNLDGLVFFDAITSGTRQRSPTSPLTPSNEPLHTHQEEPLARCLAEYLGDDAFEKELLRNPRRSLIRRLQSRYPQGHVFAMDQHGVLDYGPHHGDNVGQHPSGSSAGSNEWDDLFKCVPKARYAIFLPLWHYQRESCFATCLAWVSNTGKTLDSADINSLTAFGNSLMAKILRLEALTNTRSKSDFVSTISHELRSPLHGILATVELMQDNTKDSHLLSMLDMIESCSSMLLDTFNHLLEFSKINSRASDPKNAGTDPTKHSLSNTRAKRVTANLDSLVDDVLETVSLGHLKLESGFRGEGQGPLDSVMDTVYSQPVLVTTTMNRNCRWFMSIDKGAWKRIIMNIFSNALKYTKAGHIEVALSILPRLDDGPRYVNLSVADTGVGMSHEFLKYHLFTPFMQENNLNPGAGLGLSIVKSIVESLDGKIFVESRQHGGTCVTVNIPVDEELEITAIPNVDGTFVPQDRLRGLSLGLLSIASQDSTTTDSTIHFISPSTELQRSARNICEGKFGMTVVDVFTDAARHVDILLLDTYAIAPTNYFDLTVLFPKQFSKPSPRAVVALRRSVKGSTPISEVEISSPITAKSLMAAFLRAIESANASKTMAPLLSPNPAGQDIQVPTVSTEHIQAQTTDSKIEQSLPITPEERKDLPKSLSPQTTLNIKDPTTEFCNPVQDPVSQGTSTPKASTSSTGACRFNRLLLVDDNAINLKVLVAFATKLGRPYSTAVDGAKAVHLYRKAMSEEHDPYDCVLMDISMPIMDGFEAVAAIRKFEKEQQQTRQRADQKTGQESNSDDSMAKPSVAQRSYILALTGLGSEQARSAAFDSGFDGYFLKPVKFKDIVPLLGPI